MSYARFWPRNWEGGLKAFYNFEGDVPAESIELMENSYYLEMIQFPKYEHSDGILWVNSWDNLGR